jgi:aldose 1-epimerase
MIDLRSGPARATVLPEMGGGLGGFWLDGLPALWSLREPREGEPFAPAMIVLAPFSNRISGGFEVGGIRHDLAPNRAGEPFPIHGDAFQRVWQVAATTDDSARLILPEGRFGPFRYRAELDYRLSGSGLEMTLRLTSTAEVALPFGAGFHPWFPRSPDTRLEFRASGGWPEDARHLPATPGPVALPNGTQGNGASALPSGFINQGFAGWDGSARIRQGAGAADLDLRATGLGTAILYSPSDSAGFFCFEPVSHPVDAHNLPGQPGLVMLDPGESLSVALSLAAS